MQVIQKNAVFFGTVVMLILSITLLGGLNSVSAKGEKVYKWKMQVVWPEATMYSENTRQMVKRIKEASKGRLDIKLFYANQLVGTKEQFNSLSMGVMQMHIWPTVYGTGKIPASTFFFSIPGGFTTSDEFRAWFYSGGGLKIIRETYAKHGVHYIAPSFYPDNPARISREKPIATLADFKGLKIRALPGLQSAVMKELGASPMYLPVDEVYSGFDKGVVDALSGYTTYGWYKMGMHKIAKYISEPGFIMGTLGLEIAANKKAWDKLPDDLKLIVEMASREMDMIASQADLLASKDALGKMKSEGMQTQVLSNEDIAKMREVAHKICDAYAEKDPVSKQVWDSQKAMLKKLGKY